MEKATIICVDDERVVLIGLKSQLKRLFGNKYYIETANSGEEAIEILDELNEDNIDVPVVISDQIMPGMKGDTFLKYVKKKFTKYIDNNAYWTSRCKRRWSSR